MKARIMLAAVALSGVAVAYAPAWVAHAQDMGKPDAKEAKKDAGDKAEKKEEKKADYASATEMLKSLNELAKTTVKDLRKPTPDELKTFFGAAFKRGAEYLDQHPDATDRDMIYSWTFRRAKYGYGQAGFVAIGKAYLKDHPDAENRDDWNDSLLFARLGIADETKAAQEDLAKAEEQAKDDPARRLELADIWLRHYANQKDTDASKKLIDKLKNDPTFAKADDPQVERRLMRTILANVDKAEIKDGEPFPDWGSIYPVKDIEGKTLSVADYKGKVLLIDFWATWCGPCMGEMPHVIKLYNEVHDQGFEIIGVTLDNETGTHDLKAVKTTIAGKGRVGEMPWRQIYDGGGWSSGLPQHYGVRSIPRTVLIDQNGVVVANGLRGEQLASKVKELLANLKSKDNDKDSGGDDKNKEKDDADK